ncbi:MAG: hypothetical protein IH804_00600 [Planctomycetes bacterium]|nr:hypothetical protein [Planctomycetota bacterium]
MRIGVRSSQIVVSSEIKAVQVRDTPATVTVPLPASIDWIRPMTVYLPESPGDLPMGI